MGDATSLSLLGRLIPATAVFIVLGVGLWWLKRRGPARIRGIQVESRTGLSRGSVVAILGIDGRRYLVGATDQNVTLLAELPAAAAATPIAGGSAAPQSTEEPTRPRSHRAAPSEEPWTGLVQTLQHWTLRKPTKPRPPRVTV